MQERCAQRGDAGQQAQAAFVVIGYFHPMAKAGEVFCAAPIFRTLICAVPVHARWVHATAAIQHRAIQ